MSASASQHWLKRSGSLTVKVKKSRLEISAQVYLNKADIETLIGLNPHQARRLYSAADQIDRNYFETFRPEPKKVRTTVVCKLAGVNLKLLQMQIKNAAAVEEHTANSK